MPDCRLTLALDLNILESISKMCNVVVKNVLQNNNDNILNIKKGQICKKKKKKLKNVINKNYNM